MPTQKMDLEATVVKRLQKLRQWQLEQQERLLKQQEIQRQMLTQKQDCMYKALELSIQELDLDKDILDINDSNESGKNTGINNKSLIMLHNRPQTKENYTQVVNENDSCVDQNISGNFENIISRQKSPTQRFIEDVINIESHIRRQSKDKTSIKNDVEEEKQLEQFIMDGVAPLPPDKIVVHHISIDDVPIFSPKKDFHTLLEERLKDSENEPPEKKSSASSGNKIKKPFLRKGEGLARFKLNQQLQPSTLKTRLHSISFTNNTQSGSKCPRNENKCNKTQHLKNAQLSKKTHCINVAQKHLCLKNVSLPKKKICSTPKSNTTTTYLKDDINEVKNAVELNTSDFHSGTQKELEEVRIFELLEEKAENSSFCSTSSAVTAFLQQSTPFKVKNAEYRMDSSVHNAKQVTPRSNIPKEQLIVKSNQAYKCMKSNKDTDTHCDFSPFINQKIIHDNIHKNIMFLENTNEDNRIKPNRNGYMSLRDQIKSIHNEQNVINRIEEDNKEVSPHVRFSEFNEYKTIGLTDTSSISTESLVTKSFSDEKAWSDSSILETSTVQTLSVPFEVSRSPVIMKSKVHKAQTCKDMTENNDSTYNTDDMYQNVCHKDESELSDAEDLTSNNEVSLHKCGQDDLTPQKIDNFYDIGIFKKNMKFCDNKKVDEYVDNHNNVVVTEDQENINYLQETNETIFKSELLKARLLELEQEINIFRKENATLSMQRKKLREDHQSLRKKYAEKEKNFEENKKQVEERLQEERKKLAREKSALENRMRDSQEKAQQSKLERQEIQNLRQEIEQLVQDMHIKESRWNAAQSRHRCQMRILKLENSKLKQEVEKLKKNNIRNKGRSGASANTRAIHQINKQINMQYKESKKVNDVSLDDDQKVTEPIMKTISIASEQDIEKRKEYNCNSNTNIMNDKPQKSQTTIIDIVKKRNLYENLIKEATLDLTEIPEKFDALENLSESKSDLNNELKKVNSQINVTKANCKKSYKECDTPFNHNGINDNIQLHVQNDYKCFNENYTKDLASADELPNIHIENISSSYRSNTSTDKQGMTQIEHPDGSIECRFPNGNIKKIFPDQGVTKLIYYNGDIRETNRDGKIKYFYASTHTWHTTMPDGLEILEFSDGQVERRLHDGTVEVLFPDGSVRIVKSDGIEKWTLPDGTLMQIFTNGEKVLTLPNGQREIHTSTHKRREYPDGTIKLIYLDGAQETRYSNGRIRLKDKDGRSRHSLGITT
ncbi:centromere protein J isoform X1 [Bombus terrestris]|uniref:Centromere protein J isoform X1 n=1 Tax=Bombus terrestris TaxID=30195 RepID=A0A9C6W837_BOMTE|nr:centromere protein J isoform X1 [Bombus terrestris]